MPIFLLTVGEKDTRLTKQFSGAILSAGFALSILHPIDSDSAKIAKVLSSNADN